MIAIFESVKILNGSMERVTLGSYVGLLFNSATNSALVPVP